MMPNNPSKQSGLESFILSQILLESLELEDCSLNIAVCYNDDEDEDLNLDKDEDNLDEDKDNSDEDEDIPPRMWSDILDEFRKVLKRLKNFKSTPFPICLYTDGLNSNSPGTGYVTFNEELGYGSILPQDSPQRDKVDLEIDAAAFTLIQQVIANRVASMDQLDLDTIFL